MAALDWPPDVFALTNVTLDRSEAFRFALPGHAGLVVMYPLVSLTLLRDRSHSMVRCGTAVVTNRPVPRQRSMRTLIALTGIVVALSLAASAMSSTAQSRSTVTVRSSQYGKILFDGRGFALYAFTKDAVRHSNCGGACAKAWPPYIVASRAAADAGVQSRLLGTTKRSDGRLQATYAGRPLYYYVGDRKPLQVLCQNVSEFGGIWLVVRPNGTLVR